MALPQSTSTASNLTPSSLAMASPMNTPSPDAHFPVLGSLEDQGGACVTPTRLLPPFITASKVPSARATNGMLTSPTPPTRQAIAERRLMVIWSLPLSPPERVQQRPEKLFGLLAPRRLWSAISRRMVSRYLPSAVLMWL